MWGGPSRKKCDPKIFSTSDNFFPVELENLGPYPPRKHTQAAIYHSQEFFPSWLVLPANHENIQKDGKVADPPACHIFPFNSLVRNSFALILFACYQGHLCGNFQCFKSIPHFWIFRYFWPPRQKSAKIQRNWVSIEASQMSAHVAPLV